jgi:peptidoglycan/xylan/chitin deacetylase (PgdA/CDA1 family)
VLLRATTQRQVQPRITVLEYHKIGVPPPRGGPTWYIPECTFVGHLKYLRESGWRVISLSEFLDGLETPSLISPRSALLTFDDAYRSLRTVALPRLRNFGCPAVVFVPTGFVGGRNDFDRGREPEEDICTWEDLEELMSYGVSVQSHGVSHRQLSRLNDSELSDEIHKSKEMLENSLGIHVETLAYPFGDVGNSFQRTRELLRKFGYRAAFIANGGRFINFPVNVYRINRLPIMPYTDLRRALD